MKHIPKSQRIYHHWAYDPNSDEVFLDDRDAEHNGYAYRIDGGWRMTDRDHGSVDDTYIIRRVLENLRGDNPDPEAPQDYDFSRLHYGQPLPIETENK